MKVNGSKILDTESAKSHIMVKAPIMATGLRVKDMARVSLLIQTKIFIQASGKMAISKALELLFSLTLA